ncbi:hypothetical protein cce_0013 [Crocosphaera subtropica ATCC 51142]|uniref:Uncharacterized protein n=1 Tax=Crocosphaera subtropica (strain ATCC 51142 / BH68) TaxID=43989 RepID=B1WYD5_CROS5|nr:hypothetical protein cce_0013 [Crocosphaera subtropica ATCC 51142]
MLNQDVTISQHQSEFNHYLDHVRYQLLKRYP